MSTNGTECAVDNEPLTPEQRAENWGSASDAQDPPAGDDAQQQQQEEQRQQEQQQQQQQQQEDELEEEEDEGTSSFRRKLPPRSAPIFMSDTGLEYTVPQEISDAVDSFQPPAGYECVGDPEQSFIYSVGNYVQPIDADSPSKPTYFCQGSAKCRKYRHQIPCTRGSRSNVNKHLQHVHQLRGVTRGAVAQSPAHAARKGQVEKVKVSEKVSAGETPEKAKKAPAALGAGRTRCVPDVQPQQQYS